MHKLNAVIREWLIVFRVDTQVKEAEVSHLLLLSQFRNYMEESQQDTGLPNIIVIGGCCFMSETAQSVTVVIIDSGVDKGHDAFANVEVNGCCAYLNDAGEIEFDENISDDFGHGTAIFDIIRKNAPDVNIYNFKVFDKEGNADQKEITKLLEYIYDRVDCDIINMSLGITQYADIGDFENVINKLNDRGTIIISAFSNDGSISFPAAFEKVIGVDSSENVRTKNQFDFVEGSIINIRAKGGKQRVLWKRPERYAIVEGNSFSAGYITAMVANLFKTQKGSQAIVLDSLKKRSVKIYAKQPDAKDTCDFKMPHKAVAFPFNKEMHSLARYYKDLSFGIQFYDIRPSGKINKNTGEFIPGSNFTIGNIEQLNWSADFDTFILGHVNQVSKLLSVDYAERIISNCLKYKKNLYAFDDLDHYHLHSAFKEKGLNLFYPTLGKKDVPNNSFGKLYFIPQPTLAICGTSLQQGKFTLQLLLRRLLMREGYKVGQIGTEPSSLLYGMDKVCAIGYGYNMALSEYPFISAVNRMVYEISQKDPDIILCGTQSGTIPYSYDNLNIIPLHTIEFLMGAKPDGVILCVNHHDDLEYIERTIYTIENLLETQVIGLTLFPLTIEYNWQGILLGSKRRLMESEICAFKRVVREKIGKDVYLLLETTDMEELKNKVIQYFEE